MTNPIERETAVPEHQYSLTIIDVGEYRGQATLLPSCGRCGVQRSRAADRRGCAGRRAEPVRPVAREPLPREPRLGAEPMGNAKRSGHYVVARGSIYLTAPQRRRLRHKANKALGSPMNPTPRRKRYAR